MKTKNLLAYIGIGVIPLFALTSSLFWITLQREDNNNNDYDNRRRHYKSTQQSLHDAFFNPPSKSSRSIPPNKGGSLASKIRALQNRMGGTDNNNNNVGQDDNHQHVELWINGRKMDSGGDDKIGSTKDNGGVDLQMSLHHGDNGTDLFLRLHTPDQLNLLLKIGDKDGNTDVDDGGNGSPNYDSRRPKKRDAQPPQQPLPSFDPPASEAEAVEVLMNLSKCLKGLNRSNINLNLVTGSVQLPTVRNPTDNDDNNNNNTQSLLDSVYLNQLPQVFPAQFQFPPFEKSGGEYLLGRWQQPVGRQHGIGPDAVSESDGGVTVLGRHWVHQTTSLLYVPILKNAHTTLSNAVGDLRQRIESHKTTSEVEVWKRGKDKKAQVGRFDDNLRKLSVNETIAFTLLRDPVDRYISGTCEELRMGSPKLKTKCFPSAETPVERSFDCLLQYAVSNLKEHPNSVYKQYLAHLRPQTFLLAETIRRDSNPSSLGLSVVPFSQLNQLLRELGNKVDEAPKVRDRSDANYYMERVTANKNGPRKGVPQTSVAARQRVMGQVANLCKLKPTDLKPAHRDIICEMYKMDVDLLRAVGIAVPWCDPK